jgi:hypothetical protein
MNIEFTIFRDFLFGEIVQLLEVIMITAFLSSWVELSWVMSYLEKPDI